MIPIPNFAQPTTRATPTSNSAQASYNMRPTGCHVLADYNSTHQRPRKEETKRRIQLEMEEERRKQEAKRLKTQDAIRIKEANKESQRRIKKELHKAGLGFIETEYPNSTFLGPVSQHVDPILAFVVRPDILKYWKDMSEEYGQEVADLVGIQVTLLDIRERVNKNNCFEFEDYLRGKFNTQQRVHDQVRRRGELRDETKKSFDKVSHSTAGFRMIRDGTLTAQEAKKVFDEICLDGYHEAKKRVMDKIVDEVITDVPFGMKSTVLSRTDTSLEDLHAMTMEEMGH